MLWSNGSYDSRGAGWAAIKHTVLNNVQRMVTVPELLALDLPSFSQLRQGLQGCYGKDRRADRAGMTSPTA